MQVKLADGNTRSEQLLARCAVVKGNYALAEQQQRKRKLLRAMTCILINGHVIETKNISESVARKRVA